MKSLFAVLVVLLGLAACASPTPRSLPVDPANTAPGEVSLNGIDLPGDAERFTILLVGHLYGGIQGEDRNPATALVEALPELKRSNLTMLISLGDMVKASQAADFEELERRVLRKLPFAVFNTPGNHDVEDRALYEQRYGQTFYSFAYGSARLIFLDTERETCGLDAPQVEMLETALAAAQRDPATRHILIFMHKTLAFRNERLYEAQNETAQPNTWTCYGQPGFDAVMHDLIEPAAASKPVYLFAGDVGAWGNLTPYYEHRDDMPITLVMTGLGDTPGDAGVLVTVSADAVDLAVYPLTDAQSLPLQSYDPAYWLDRAGVR